MSGNARPRQFSFFSGFIFPRETMPWIFSAIGACMPVTYFITILAAMGAALFSLCTVRFRKKLG